MNSQAKTSQNDARVGLNLRRLRMNGGVTMLQLGRHLGISYQLINKFERGRTRISAGYLPLIAERLNVSIDDLFSDCQTNLQARPRQRITSFMRDAMNITNHEQLAALNSVAKALAEQSEDARDAKLSHYTLPETL